MIFLGLIVGCYYEVEEDLVEGEPVCNTEDVSYQSTILPILESRCFKCHSAALNLGNITLEGYDLLRRQIDNGRLLGAIQRANGFSPMPQNESMLPDCQINQFESWINDTAHKNK